MTLLKIDQPRRIDQFVDYFGEPHRAASNGSREPYLGAAGDPRELHLRKEAPESVMIVHAFWTYA